MKYFKMDILIDDIQFNNLVEAEMENLYHGSSADFDKFDLSFFGSGTGFSRYGYGIYLTDVLREANEYAEKAYESKSLSSWGKIMKKVVAFIDSNNIQRTLVSNFLAKMSVKMISWEQKKIYSEFKKFFNKIKDEIPHEHMGLFDKLREDVLKDLEYFPKKVTYKIVLRKKGEDFNFLKWDEKIGKELAEFLNNEIIKLKNDGVLDEYFEVMPMMTGEAIYKKIYEHSTFNSYKETSEWFNSIGFDGIKPFYDNFYIIFDPSLINIVEKK